MRRLGELLVAEGLLSENAIDRALGYQRVSGDRVRLGSILLNWDLLAEDALLATLAKFHRCPPVSGAMLSEAPMEVVRLLTSVHAARLAAIPYALEKNVLRVAFMNPSDLSGIDEVSLLTRKRIAPGVTTEIRLMQAHQRLYGRHIPQEFRAILQKIERRTRRTKRPDPTMANSSSLLDAAQETRAQGIAPEPQSSWPAQPIPVEPGLDSLSPPDLPSLGRAESNSAEIRDLIPTVPPPRPTRQADPMKEAAASPPVEREDPIRSGEDSLSEWVGEALTAFQRERGIGEPSGSPPADRNASDDATHPGAHSRARFPSLEDETEYSGMWRPSPLEESDESVSGMWTSPSEEPGPQLWEARSRDEIGEAVLQNALTFLPRVILFGAGKTAITGWRGRGPRLTTEDVASVRIAAAERSIFRTVIESGTPHFGLVDRTEWPQALEPLLGATPPECALFPIRILDGVAAFLYADRLGQAMQYSDFAMIARAAAATANVLSRFLLKQNTPVG